ncbi:MAG: DNA polymerase IV [Patescibacteria group bacterium]
MRRIIAHLDMDAFFASIEENDNPELKGKPIVVGADPKYGKGRGVVSTANYKAREYGIYSGMPISQAWKLSEKAKLEGKEPVVFIKPNFEKYKEVSESIISIVKKYSNLTEIASIDEVYFDLSYLKSFKKAKEVCLKIKEEIKKKERLTCSIGIGPNKLIAKIASSYKKPDGLTIVKNPEKFLENLSIRVIPGIGPKTEEILNKMGIFVVKDLKKFSQKELYKLFGKFGLELYKKVRGIDETPLFEEYPIKSIGKQITFEKDTRKLSFIYDELQKLCKDVYQTFRDEKFDYFRTITVTVRFKDFETKTRSFTFKEKMNDLKTLIIQSTRLLMELINQNKKLIRMIGIRIEKLE